MAVFAKTLVEGFHFLPEPVTLSRPQATPNSGTLSTVNIPLMVQSFSKALLPHVAGKADFLNHLGLAVIAIAVVTFPKKHFGGNTYALRFIPPMSHYCVLSREGLIQREEN
jgi:hypothetical protein